MDELNHNKSRDYSVCPHLDPSASLGEQDGFVVTTENS